MALLAGVPSLFAVYRPDSATTKNSPSRLVVWGAVLTLATYTTNQYARYRSIYEDVPGIAPVLLYLGLVPLWYQLGLVG
jgi:hypothetical protein